MKMVFAGLSVTSSWGNGHATTYRALLRALSARGHEVLFLERDVPWYAENRDMPDPPYCRTRLYTSLSDLERSADEIREADLVVLGSYVPQGIAVGEMLLRTAQGCKAFYDIDTPITLGALQRGDGDYLDRRQVPAFDLYLSFTGGPTLERLEQQFGARCARALYCSVDAELYCDNPAIGPDRDLGYLGTYSVDRQPAVAQLLLKPAAAWPAGRFVIAGPQYPDSMESPANVERIAHLAPSDHRAFYNRLRFTLNVTRRDMIEAGYSPSVRLFEAAACGTPIVSDYWTGLDTFFAPDSEILIARRPSDVLAVLRDMPENRRRKIGEAARARVLASHTATTRAAELESYVEEISRRPPGAAATGAIGRDSQGSVVASARTAC